MGEHPIALAGSMLLVSTSLPVAQSASAYAVLEYTLVRGVKLIGEIGNQYATTSFNYIGLERPYKRMSGLAELDVQVELIRVSDAGQDILRGAVGSPQNYSYCVRRPDGSELYFSAQINALLNGGFDAKSVAQQRCTMAVVSKIFEAN